MTDQSRQLLVLRHAKAEAFAASDHDRVLTERGRADAAAVGRWLATVGLAPDYVVVSSSVRTQETWAEVAGSAGLTPEVVNDRSLYAAGTDAAMEIIRSVPVDARSVMLVGHNPTMAYLVHLLDDGGAEPSVFTEVSSGYPTSAITVLDVPGAWDALDIAGARIKNFHVGRG